MTQVFANDDPAADAPALVRPARIPAQGGGPDRAPAHSPAMTPGKGVRQIRCVGCSKDTLPRNDDGAPLCQRCSELLAQDEASPLAGLAGPLASRTPRWLRRTLLG